MASGGIRKRIFGVIAWTAGLLVAVALTVVSALMLPSEVNTVGYLVGAERQVPFHTLVQDEECTIRSCTNYTEGYLGGSSNLIKVRAKMPTGTTVPVREPLWWNHKDGSAIVTGIASPIGGLFIMLLLNLFTGVVLFVTGSNIKEKLTAARAKRRPAANQSP